MLREARQRRVRPERLLGAGTRSDDEKRPERVVTNAAKNRVSRPVRRKRLHAGGGNSWARAPAPRRRRRRAASGAKPSEEREAPRRAATIR